MCSELEGEGDRTKVILVSALLENALCYRLLLSFPHELTLEERDYFLRFDGPLGTFSQRIEIAYLIGAIDKVTAQQLHTIRAMRNDCAHSQLKLTFAMPELANVAKRLF
jgi:hypothetical protein